MTYLNKKEITYFLVIGVVSMFMLVGTLFVWSKTQVKCWEQYSTEEQAITKCEGE